MTQNKIEIPKFKVEFKDNPRLMSNNNQVSIQFISDIPEPVKKYLGDVLTNEFSEKLMSAEDAKIIETFITTIMIELVNSNQIIKQEDSIDKWKLNIISPTAGEGK